MQLRGLKMSRKKYSLKYLVYITSFLVFIISCKEEKTKNEHAIETTRYGLY
jgi:hypothetical protein